MINPLISKRVHLAQINIKDIGTYSEFAPTTSEELVQEALTIGNYLIGNAIHYEKDCNWIELEYMFRANRYRLKPLDNSLYSATRYSAGAGYQLLRLAYPESLPSVLILE